MERDKGFSLLEVVVALAILGIGVVSLIQLFSGSLRTVKKAEEYSNALLYARSMLDEAYAMPDVRDAGGRFDLKEGFSAERSVKVISATDNTALYEISVGVVWPSGRVELKGERVFREKKKK